MGFTYGTLQGSTRSHTLGFHEEDCQDPRAAPLYSRQTDAAGDYSLYLPGPRRYRVSVDGRHWTEPAVLSVLAGSVRIDLRAMYEPCLNQSTD
jgi:hypothetical protein